MANVFTYGTLEIPEIMEAVTGRIFPSIEATAHGFARFLIKGRIYPGMMSDSKASTSGRLYLNIDVRTLKILDQFEDEVYSRQSISVWTQNGKGTEAYAYIIPQEHEKILTTQLWNRDYFIEHDLLEYIMSCKDFYRVITEGK